MAKNQSQQPEESSMSVAGILSTAAFSLGAQFFQTRNHKMKHELQQLGKDLRSGDLSAAQTDLAALQKLQPKPVTASTSLTGGTIAKDLTQLSADLKTGDAKAAQQDFTQLQQDLQAQVAGARHPRHADGAGQVNQMFTQLGTALQSGNLAAAQQAYSTMLQTFQQYGSAGSSASSPAANAISLTA